MNTRRIIRTLFVVALGAVVLVPATASAQTQNTTFNVTAQVNRNCTISATALAFGAYDPVVANATVPLDGTSTISVACTRNSNGVWVGLDTGTHATRQMAEPGGTLLPYDLFSDAAGGTVWTNLQTVGGTWPLFANKNPVGRTVFGRIPANQDRKLQCLQH